MSLWADFIQRGIPRTILTLVAASVFIHAPGAGIASGQSETEQRGVQELKRADGPRLEGHRRSVLGAEIVAHGMQVVTCSRDATIRVWDAQSGEELKRFGDANTTLLASIVAADSKVQQIAAAGPAGPERPFGRGMWRNPPFWFGSVVSIWDVPTGRLARVLPMSAQFLPLGVAISRDGRRVSCIARDLSVMLWDMNTGRVLSFVPGLPEDAVAAMEPPNQMWSYSSDLLKVAALAKGEADGPDVIFHCDLARRTVHRIAVAGELSGQCRAVAVKADGSELAAWVDRRDGTTSLWVFDLDNGRTKRRLSTPPLSDVSYLAFSPDGHLLVAGSTEGRLRVLNSTTGALLAESNVSNEPIRSASFLQDRLRILSGQGSTSMTNWAPRAFSVAEPLTLTDLWMRISAEP
jgi:WD40 repeat protein